MKRGRIADIVGGNYGQQYVEFPPTVIGKGAWL